MNVDPSTTSGYGVSTRIRGLENILETRNNPLQGIEFRRYCALWGCCQLQGVYWTREQNFGCQELSPEALTI